MCPMQGNKEALMSLTTTVVLLILGWLAVAAAMLWGVLRITRRHHHAYRTPQAPAPEHKPEQPHASAH